MQRRAFIFGSILATAATLIGSGVIGYVVQTEKAQAKRNAKRAAEQRQSNRASKTLVVYFSRSGNTELMAMEIANLMSADVIRLEAEDYRLGLWGWINAMRDARNNHAVIKPQKIDLSDYGTILIGTPIWLYSPAPPVWQFIAANEFSGQRVVLFNTFNSKFEQTFINQFREAVLSRGGNFTDHIWVKRGRMTDQIDTEEMLQKTRRQIQNL